MQYVVAVIGLALMAAGALIRRHPTRGRPRRDPAGGDAATGEPDRRQQLELISWILIGAGAFAFATVAVGF